MVIIFTKIRAHGIFELKDCILAKLQGFAMSKTVKELIDLLEHRFGLRQAAKKLGTSHQRLMNMRDHGHKTAEVIELFEKMKKLLKLNQKDALLLAKKPPIVK